MTKRALLAVGGVLAFCALPIRGDGASKKPDGHGLRLEPPTIAAPSGKRVERDDEPEREKRAQIDAEEIWFASRHFLRPADGVDPGVRLPLRGVYVAQFHGPILKEWREALEAAGARILDYVQNYAYIIEVPEAFSSDVVALAQGGLLRYLGPYPAEAKIAWGLQQAAKSRPPEEDIEITVRFFDVPSEAQKGAVSNILAVAKWEDDPVMPFARGAAEPGRLQLIAELPFVKWVEEYVPGELHNIEGSMSGGADRVVGWGTYDGTGIRVAVDDSGITRTGDSAECGASGAAYHPDLGSGRIADQWDFENNDSNACDDDGHGTHTAGSIGGDGTNTSDWTGIAPGATFLIYKDCCDNKGLGFGNFVNVLTRAALNDANIVANSWGGGNDDYNWASEAADNAVRGKWPGSDTDPQYMNVTVSSGNDNDLCSRPATGKNVIAVGAMRDGNWPDEPGTWCWCVNNGSCGVKGCLPSKSCADNYWPPTGRICFSNYGPVDTDNDGNYRIKPDVMAPGTRITSTAAVHMESPLDLIDGFYVPYDGTSMAQPMVAGTVALMVEANPGFVDCPEAIKARLLATAVDLGDTNIYGHGMVDALHAVYDSSSLTTALWAEGTITGTGDLYDIDHTFTVPAGYEEVRVYLTWSDPATTLTEVVNNLDLRVYDGTDAEVGSSLSLDDTVEYVRLSGYVAGSWRANVWGFDVPQPNQKYGIIAVVVLNAPSRSLSASASPTCLQPSQTFTISTTHSNSGYSVVGSQIQLDLPDDTSLFSLQDVDMATGDAGRSHTYLESELWRDVPLNRYYLATGIVNQDISRSATWNLQVGAGTADGTYDFYVDASAAGEGILGEIVTVTVTADVSPTAAPTVNIDPACEGETQAFMANNVGGDTFLWDFGDAATSTLQNPTHMYAGAGSYTVTLTVTDSGTGCSSGPVGVATNPVDVLASPTAAPTVDVDPACEGETQAFMANNVGGDTFLWDFGDATTSTLQNPTHMYAGAGSYTVTLTVTDSGTGCSSGPVGVATNPVEVSVCVAPPDEPSNALIEPGAPPLKIVALDGSLEDIQDESASGATDYVVYENAIGTWYGTPTSSGCWADIGPGAEPGTVRLDYPMQPGDRWIVVTAANAAGESSAGRSWDSGAGFVERNTAPGWPVGPFCP